MSGSSQTRESRERRVRDDSRVCTEARGNGGSVRSQTGDPGEGQRGRNIRDGKRFSLGYSEIHKYVSHPGEDVQLEVDGLVSKESS